VVRALNFVLEDTVEFRVRQVLEAKLAVIAEEFGVDKASDVMDSVESDPLFDALFVQGLQHPDTLEQECEAVLTELKETLAESQQSTTLLAGNQVLEADEARRWREHPAQFWLERAITAGLPARGGLASKLAQGWRVKWGDGSESEQVCFDARTAEEHPECEWVTLEDPRARAFLSNLPRYVAGQPLPCVRLGGLPESISGVWSLWEISLSAEGFNRRRFLPLFATDDGRTFVPTAKRIWDLLLTENVLIKGVAEVADAVGWFEVSWAAAKTQGQQLYAALKAEHETQLQEERDRANYAFAARNQAISRLGLPAVREHRRRRLEKEHRTRLAVLDAAEASVPDLHAVLMLRVGEKGAPAV
jgi:hypothetical protein